MFKSAKTLKNRFCYRFSGQDAVIGCVGCFLDTNIIKNDTTIEKSNRSDGDSGGPSRRHHQRSQCGTLVSAGAKLRDVDRTGLHVGPLIRCGQGFGHAELDTGAIRDDLLLII